MQIFHFPFKAMASGCEIVVAGENEWQARTLAQQAIDEVLRIEAKFSRYRPDSIISRINAAAGQAPIDCDEETWALFEYADALYKTSDGVFDITSGVLRRAWNFNVPRLPAGEELAELLQLIGWPLVELDQRRVRLSQVGMEIDFGGFGKEYAADRAGLILTAQGARHGYVNLAGDIHVIGPKPDGQPWMIGIQHPRNRKQLIATIPVSRGGLATSGDYERFFELDGKRYCHLLDPRSGWPVTYWSSVSVIAHWAVVAGNCTTIAMLKQSEGRAFLEATGMSYLAMDQQGAIHLHDNKKAQSLRQDFPLPSTLSGEH